MYSFIFNDKCFQEIFFYHRKLEFWYRVFVHIIKQDKNYFDCISIAHSNVHEIHGNLCIIYNTNVNQLHQFNNELFETLNESLLGHDARNVFYTALSKAEFERKQKIFEIMEILQ